MTLKQQLNAKPLICFGMCYVVFLSRSLEESNEVYAKESKEVCAKNNKKSCIIITVILFFLCSGNAAAAAEVPGGDHRGQGCQGARGGDTEERAGVPEVTAPVGAGGEAAHGGHAQSGDQCTPGQSQ